MLASFVSKGIWSFVSFSKRGGKRNFCPRLLFPCVSCYLQANSPRPVSARGFFVLFFLHALALGSLTTTFLFFSFCISMWNTLIRLFLEVGFCTWDVEIKAKCLLGRLGTEGSGEQVIRYHNHSNARCCVSPSYSIVTAVFLADD